MSRREDLFATVDVVKAILALMDEAAGPKTLDEMHPDALIPMSNGYSNWFTSPEIARLGTAGLRPSEIAERVERRLRDE